MEELTQENFEEKIGTGNVIVDFWAPWCGPCKILGPNFEAASKNHDDVNFYKLNVDDVGSVASDLGVRSIPTLILFKDGEEAERLVGAMSQDKISERVKIVFG